MVLIASAGDNTIKFDEACISVGNIDLGDGHNKLIISFRRITDFRRYFRRISPP